MPSSVHAAPLLITHAQTNSLIRHYLDTDMTAILMFNVTLKCTRHGNPPLQYSSTVTETWFPTVFKSKNMLVMSI